MREEEREGEEKSNQKNITSALKQPVSLFLDLLLAALLLGLYILLIVHFLHPHTQIPSEAQ